MDNFHKNLPKRGICIYCGKFQKIFYGRIIKTVEYRGKEVKYEEIQPYCLKCGWPLDATGCWDENLKRVQEVYKEKYGKH